MWTVKSAMWWMSTTLKLPQAKVIGLHKDKNNMITSLTYEKDGKEHTISGDYIISSMPIKDLEHTVWVGLEYFVTEGGEFWSMTEEEFSKLGIREMLQLGLIDSADQVIDTHMEKVKKAYPAYFDTYDEMDPLVAWLKSTKLLLKKWQRWTKQNTGSFAKKLPVFFTIHIHIWYKERSLY